MGDRGQISVIIPVYNGERYLAETIESVLVQTYKPIEFIIIDDGSTDGSAPIAKSFGSSIRYYYQPNLGTAAALNRGIKMACGDYLAFLGADDIWTENRIQLQVAAFNSNPCVDIVAGHVKQFLSPELDEGTKRKIRYSAELTPGHVLPAMLIKREAFLSVGPFETEWKIGAEMNWYLLAMEKGLRIMMLPDLVLLRRLHERNQGITQARFIAERVRILKMSLDRRRRQEDL